MDMEKNLDDPTTEKERKSWYEITLRDGKKVGKIGDICGYCGSFEAYIDQTRSDVTIKNAYYCSKQNYKQDVLRFHPDKTHMVTTYYLSTQNPSGIKLNRIIASWVIQMSTVIIKNSMSMIQRLVSLGKYGESSRVLMRILNLNMEGEINLFRRKKK